METVLAAASCAMLLCGCGCGETAHVKGIVTDAAMNTVTIAADGDDTLTFSMVEADRSGLRGLLIGDSLEVGYTGKYSSGMDAASVATVSKAAENSLMRMYREGIRTESADGNVVIVLFGPDSLEAELHDPRTCSVEVLQRRNLPSGGHVWNVEDDDTRNLRQTDGLWTISRRGRLIWSQPVSDAAPTAGEWVETVFSGEVPAADGDGETTECTVRVLSRAHSGDGRFMLRVGAPNEVTGKNLILIGRRYTQRGAHGNPDAVVWQLVPDNADESLFFLFDDAAATLTLLTEGDESAGVVLRH